jgi:hypothetical protein
MSTRIRVRRAHPRCSSLDRFRRFEPSPVVGRAIDRIRELLSEQQLRGELLEIAVREKRAASIGAQEGNVVVQRPALLRAAVELVEVDSSRHVELIGRL